MNNVPIIDPLKGQKGISISNSQNRRAKTNRPNSQRNDNPVSRYFDQINSGKRSLRSAINAMCGHCMGCTAKEQRYNERDWIEPGFRKQIRTCSTPACPLWQVRPYQIDGDKKSGECA